MYLPLGWAVRAENSTGDPSIADREMETKPYIGFRQNLLDLGFRHLLNSQGGPSTFLRGTSESQFGDISRPASGLIGMNVLLVLRKKKSDGLVRRTVRESWV